MIYFTINETIKKIYVYTVHLGKAAKSDRNIGKFTIYTDSGGIRLSAMACEHNQITMKCSSILWHLTPPPPSVDSKAYQFPKL